MLESSRQATDEEILMNSNMKALNETTIVLKPAPSSKKRDSKFKLSLHVDTGPSIQ